MSENEDKVGWVNMRHKVRIQTPPVRILFKNCTDIWEFDTDTHVCIFLGIAGLFRGFYHSFLTKKKTPQIFFFIFYLNKKMK